MSENMYGDSSQRPESPLGEPVVTSKKKSEDKGYLLRVQAMGSAIELVSPIPRDKFVEEMVDTITTQGANPDWSGWYHLKKTDDKIVSIRLRSIDVVEEL